MTKHINLVISNPHKIKEAAAANLEHRALSIKPADKVVFTAMSKKYFYLRFFAIKFVLEQGAAPINPFASFDYFLLDAVERDTVRRANNTLVARADELWVFGSIADGVRAEIIQAQQQNKPVRFFTFKNDRDIYEVSQSELVYEDGVDDKTINRESEIRETATKLRKKNRTSVVSGNAIRKMALPWRN